MGIKLYSWPRSLGTRVGWALEELGVPCECVEPDAKKHEHRSAKYLAVNPHAKGPALVDGDQTFFESDTILLRLGNKYGVEKNLWPAGRGQARVDAISWTAWAMTELGPYLFQDLHHGFGAMLGLKLDKHLRVARGSSAAGSARRSSSPARADPARRGAYVDARSKESVFRVVRGIVMMVLRCGATHFAANRPLEADPTS